MGFAGVPGEGLVVGHFFGCPGVVVMDVLDCRWRWLSSVFSLTLVVSYIRFVVLCSYVSEAVFVADSFRLMTTAYTEESMSQRLREHM